MSYSFKLNPQLITDQGTSILLNSPDFQYVRQVVEQLSPNGEIKYTDGQNIYDYPVLAGENLYIPSQAEVQILVPNVHLANQLAVALNDYAPFVIYILIRQVDNLYIEVCDH